MQDLEEELEENIIPESRLPICSSCCWMWETPEIEIYCRLCLDPIECGGPR